MVMYLTPEEHAANPPSTWYVEQSATDDRRWYLKDRQGTILDAGLTRGGVESMRTHGFMFDLWHDEQLWFHGGDSKIIGRKPYAECADRMNTRAVLQSEESPTPTGKNDQR